MITETFEQFDKQFPTDEACKDNIVAKRWPDGVRCPRCNASERIYARKGKPYYWVCCNKGCGERRGYGFSVTTGTIFSDTKVSLRIWFKIGYLMLTAKKGISSLQVRRVIFGEDSGTDWRTAWYICHRWRAAMRGDAFPLTGHVEVDETYVGGKDANRHWGKKSANATKRDPKKAKRYGDPTIAFGKVGVVGAIERKGSVVARVIGDMDARTLKSFVNRSVSENVTLVASDENPAYTYIDPHKMSVHRVVKHGAGEYVRGDVHTNNIENFSSLLKRGIVGTYHRVSKDYLPLYLNEFSYRHNNRHNPNVFADLITTCGNN
jgi:hypothetical protein